MRFWILWNCYSDPSLMLQLGMLAKVYRDGLINVSPLRPIWYTTGGSASAAFYLSDAYSVFPAGYAFQKCFPRIGGKVLRDAQVACERWICCRRDYNERHSMPFYTA
jgi:hypothetical protein